MSAGQGFFCWYELMTSDAAAAKAFYRTVAGVDFKPFGAEATGAPYDVIMAGETGTGGLMTIPEEARAHGARPGWIGYIAVDDVDAYAARVTQAGGSIHRAPDDIPTVGRFAIVADPHGAAFTLFKPFVDAPPLPALPNQTGFFAWRELMAGNGPEAFDFYAALFGWTKGDGVDMGPMGVYQLFLDDRNSEPVGGMMTKPPQMPVAFWNYYLQVESVEASVALMKEAGGTVIAGPHPVPGDKWIVQARDPQGAMFCLISNQA